MASHGWYPRGAWGLNKAGQTQSLWTVYRHCSCRWAAPVANVSPFPVTRSVLSSSCGSSWVWAACSACWEELDLHPQESQPVRRLPLVKGGSDCPPSAISRDQGSSITRLSRPPFQTHPFLPSWRRTGVLRVWYTDLGHSLRTLSEFCEVKSTFQLTLRKYPVSHDSESFMSYLALREVDCLQSHVQAAHHRDLFLRRTLCTGA